MNLYWWNWYILNHKHLLLTSIICHFFCSVSIIPKVHLNFPIVQCYCWGRDTVAGSLDIMSYSHPQYPALKQQFCGIFGFPATATATLTCHATFTKSRPHATKIFPHDKKYFTHKTTINTILLTSQKLFVIKGIKICTQNDHPNVRVENILFFSHNEYSHTL